MITLNLEDVKAAARKAYAEGRLSAQAPEPVCEYRSVQDGKTYACGIGAAMTDEQVAELLSTEGGDDFETLNGSGLDDLSLKYRIRTDDFAGVLAIQEAHDGWASLGGESQASQDRFLRLIAE